MKKFILLCVVIGVFGVAPQCAGDLDSGSLYLLRQVDMNSDFGNPVETYEDVDYITNIRLEHSGNNPFINQGDLQSNYVLPIRESTGKALINKINATGGVAFSSTAGNFVDFANNGIFYLDGGYYDEYGVWQTNRINSFPHDYKNTKNPHKIFYNYCIRGGFKYVKPPLVIPPNAKSCDHNRNWCYHPPCTKQVKEDGDENGNGIYGEILVYGNHPPFAPNNVYVDLAAKIEGYLKTATEIKESESGKTFYINFKDRTPPTIEGFTGDDFPELGNIVPATTGDWYKSDGFIIKDNATKKIGVGIAIGAIATAPPPLWRDGEDWVIVNSRVIDTGEEAKHIILPNSCHGVMRYSIFAWDENGLLNPGEPKIENNKPKVCYGLRNTPVTNLITDPFEAMPWPIPPLDFTKSTDLDYLNKNIDISQKRSEGYLHVRDNDLPNLVIKIESTKDNKRIFFPPVLMPGDITINPSGEYKAGLGLPNANKTDYLNFITPFAGITHESNLLKDPVNPLYFRIFDVTPSPVMTAADVALLNKFKDPAQSAFIRNHFRLEDHNLSDTLDNSGMPDTSPDNFGQRCSFGESVVALLELPANEMIQEDVEYLIDVWADDNVKWATNKASDNMVSVPTGIVAGEIKVSIPNQYPPFNTKVLMDKNESVNGKLKVVFREPTPDVALNNESDLIAHKFPFIEVKVSDYSGLTRKIKLYLRVSNENPEIRVIDRKHEKRD